MAYVLFGERLDAIAIAGMVACAAAVFLVNRAQDLNPIIADSIRADTRPAEPVDPRCAIAHRGISMRSLDRHLGGHFGCGTIRIYGFGDFQPCG